MEEGYNAKASKWFESARTGDIKYIVENCKSFQGTTELEFPYHTAISIAALEGHISIVKYLFPYEKDVLPGSGWTPLMSAALSGHAAIASYLISFYSGKTLLSQVFSYPAGTSAIIIAASTGSLDTVGLLAANALEAASWPPIFLASILGNESVIAAHSKSGAPVADILCRTPLMYSALAAKPSAACIQALAPMYKDRTDSFGKTATMLAAEYGRDGSLALLLRHCPNEVNMRLQPEFVDHQRIPDTATGADAPGASASAQLAHSQLAQEPQVVTPTQHDRTGGSGGFGVPSGPGRQRFAGLALDQSIVDVTAPQNAAVSHARGATSLFSNATCLMLAAYYGHPECAKLLLAQARLRNTFGMTALMLASRANRLDVCSLLTGAEATMATVEAYSNVAAGSTALMFAAIKGHPNVVGLLAPIEHGIRNGSGQSAYNFACHYMHAACQDVLAVYDDETAYALVNSLVLSGRREEGAQPSVTARPLSEALARLSEVLGVQTADEFYEACGRLAAAQDREARLAAAEAEAETLRRELRGSQASIDSHAASAAALEEQQGSLRAALAGAQEAGGALQQTVLRQEDEARELQAAVIILRSRLNEEFYRQGLLAADSDALGQENHELRAANERYQQELQFLKISDTENASAIEAEKARGQALEDVACGLRTELAGLQEQAAGLRAERDALAREARASVEAVEGAQRDLAAAHARVERMQDLEAELQRLRAALRQKARRLAEANTVISLISDDMWICTKRLSDTMRRTQHSIRDLREAAEEDAGTNVDVDVDAGVGASIDAAAHASTGAGAGGCDSACGEADDDSPKLTPESYVRKPLILNPDLIDEPVHPVTQSVGVPLPQP